MSPRSLRLWIGALAVVGFGLTASPANASFTTYGFKNVTNNDVNDTNAGNAQLRVDVIDLGGGQVGFKFYHATSMTTPMSIADVYFDDGTLLGIANITQSAGVDFSQGAAPGNLPGGGPINFNTTAGFSADTNPPVQPNGVHPGEWLQIDFNLIGGKTYADTIAAISLSLANPGVDVSGGLRIGIHVQGFTGGGSESFVNGGPVGNIVEPVPAPAGLVLLASAAPFALVLRRQAVAA